MIFNDLMGPTNDLSVGQVEGDNDDNLATTSH